MSAKSERNKRESVGLDESHLCQRATKESILHTGHDDLEHLGVDGACEAVLNERKRANRSESFRSALLGAEKMEQIQGKDI
jgi:hypothetical protein